MNRKPAVRLLAGGVAAVALVLLAGCATRALHTARFEFYQGRLDQADRSLDGSAPRQDRVLFLMERGMVRLFLGRYADSARDFIAAYDRLAELETYSLSRGGASMVANDTVQDFRGFPYERTLLHAFTAKSHWAGGDWENAAVEARRLLQSLDPDVLGEYPDIAYARYVAGAAFELIGDDSNARLQYRKAAELATGARVDPESGRTEGLAPAPGQAELLCFVLMGRAPNPQRMVLQDLNPHAELYAGPTRLGRSQPLTDTADLAFTSQQKDAARQVVKTVARVAMKEGIAHQIEKDNELLGELVRFVLIGLLEQPDTRRWETLPRYLHVARVPCPPDLKEFTVTFRTSGGAPLASRTVSAPLRRYGNLFVSFVRDVGGPPPVPGP